MIRLFAAAALCVALVAFGRAQPDHAHIVIDTDCAQTTVQAFGGDLGYPGPSQVTCEYDSLGTVVHVDIRVFDKRQSWIYLPLVNSSE